MDEDLVLLHQAHFSTRTFLDGVCAGSQILHLCGKRIVTCRESLVGFLLCMHLFLELAHTLPSAFSPPKWVLGDGNQQYQDNEQ